MSRAQPIPVYWCFLTRLVVEDIHKKQHQTPLLLINGPRVIERSVPCRCRFALLLWGCFVDAHTTQKMQTIDLQHSLWHGCRGNHEIQLDLRSACCLLNTEEE